LQFVELKLRLLLRLSVRSERLPKKLTFTDQRFDADRDRGLLVFFRENPYFFGIRLAAVPF
jgi:hypothetical protein